jgi:hypothetical protein
MKHRPTALANPRRRGEDLFPQRVGICELDTHIIGQDDHLLGRRAA